MHYMCESCEQIYTTMITATNCCPVAVKEIPDDQVVYCPNCHSDGCSECHDIPIRLKREVERSALLRSKYGPQAAVPIVVADQDVSQPPPWRWEV
jgi:hypothetical protein